MSSITGFLRAVFVVRLGGYRTKCVALIGFFPLCLLAYSGKLLIWVNSSLGQNVLLELGLFPLFAR